MRRIAISAVFLGGCTLIGGFFGYHVASEAGDMGSPAETATLTAGVTSGAAGTQLGIDKHACDGLTTNCNAFPILHEHDPAFARDPVLYLPLDVDCKIATPPCTATGTVTNVAGHIGGAAHFDAHSSIDESFRATGDMAAAQPVLRRYSVCAWFRESDFQKAYTIFSSSGRTGDGANTRVIVYEDIDRSIRLAGPQPLASGPLSAGWHQVCLTADADLTTDEELVPVPARLYIDGAPAASALLPVGWNTLRVPVHVGSAGVDSAPDYSPWSGELDEVIVWDDVLTPAQIATLYAFQKNARAGSLVSNILPPGDGTGPWTLKWVTPLPYGKALPDGQAESATDYIGLMQKIPLTTGMRALWHMNDTDVSKPIHDSVGMPEHSGVGFYITADSAGKIGAAIFVASQGGINISNGDLFSGAIDPDLGLGTPAPAVTIAGWVRLNQPPPVATDYGFTIMALSRSVLQLYVNRMHPGGGGLVGRYIGQSLSDPSNIIAHDVNGPLIDADWHHIAFVVDSAKSTNTALLYLDGRSVMHNDEAVQLNPVQPGLMTAIGYYPNGGASNAPLNGWIDELAVWERALSADEIRAVYQRAANQLSFQVRVCESATACTGAWSSPDGSAHFFTEQDVNTSAGPSVHLASTFATAPFLQYRVIFASDDVVGACAGGACSPVLTKTTLGRAQ